MTILYKPVLIESAEQAEALPVGTVAMRHDDNWHDAAIKLYDNAWQEASAEDWASSNGEMVGWTALVPIEAEEETTARVQGFAGVLHVSRATGSFPTPQRRYVTPWEEA